MIKTSDLTQPHYRTGEVAKLLGLHVRTVRRAVDTGTIKGSIAPSGHCRIDVEEVKRQLELRGMLYDDSQDKRPDYIYARVSSQELSDNGDLDAQITTVKLGAIDHNPHNLTAISDIASDSTQSRKGLNFLIDEAASGKVNRIFVSNKDRLTVDGYYFLEKLFSTHGVDIVVIEK